MNQSDGFVVDGSEPIELPLDRSKYRRQLNPLPKALAAVALVGLGLVLAYRAGKKRGKVD